MVAVTSATVAHLEIPARPHLPFASSYSNCRIHSPLSTPSSPSAPSPLLPPALCPPSRASNQLMRLSREGLDGAQSLGSSLYPFAALKADHSCRKFTQGTRQSASMKLTSLLMDMLGHAHCFAMNLLLFHQCPHIAITWGPLLRFLRLYPFHVSLQRAASRYERVRDGSHRARQIRREQDPHGVRPADRARARWAPGRAGGHAGQPHHRVRP